MFCGLKSRWTTPSLCAASSAPHNMPGDLQRALHRQLALGGEKLMQVLSLDIRHGDELHSGGLAQVVNAQDVLVGNFAGQQQFLLEALLHRGVQRQAGTDQLERHGSVQFLVPGLVNRAHAALSKHAVDAIAGAEIHLVRTAAGAQRRPRPRRGRTERSLRAARDRKRGGRRCPCCSSLYRRRRRQTHADKGLGLARRHQSCATANAVSI